MDLHDELEALPKESIQSNVEEQLDEAKNDDDYTTDEVEDDANDDDTTMLMKRMVESTMVKTMLKWRTCQSLMRPLRTF